MEMTIEKILPAILQDASSDSVEGRNCRAMLESMFGVVSVCMPIFDLAMRVLNEGSVGSQSLVR